MPDDEPAVPASPPPAVPAGAPPEAKPPGRPPPPPMPFITDVSYRAKDDDAGKGPVEVEVRKITRGGK
jgi:hypothetical protein